MIRHLFNFAAGTAFLLAIAVCVFWSRSYRQSDKVTWMSEHSRTSLRSAPGQVVFGLYSANFPVSGRDPRGLSYTRDVPATPQWEIVSVLLLCSDPTARLVQWDRGGFTWSHRRSSRDLILTAVAPFWSVALAAGAVPLGWTGLRLRARLRARRGATLGRCPACGYDLRATPDLCPECGRPTGRVTGPRPSPAGQLRCA